MEQRVIFTGQGTVELEEFALEPPGQGEVAIRTRLTLISTGTEGIVLNRLYEPGTHWERFGKYPFRPGYCLVGEVMEIGDGVETLKPGDRVTARLGHASAHTAPEHKCRRIPEDVEDAEAVWFGLAKIAAMGARAADYRLGASALIIGAGPIGQMSVRWAALCGLENLFVVDPMKSRLTHAKAGGATHVLAGVLEGVLEQIEELNHGAKPEIVMDTTGNAAVFAGALAAAERFGKVIVLGDAGSPGRQALTSDVIIRGLRIIGAHDIHETPEWNTPRIARLFLNLVATKRFPTENLITHRFAPQEAPRAYALLTEKRAETLGVVFEWAS